MSAPDEDEPRRSVKQLTEEELSEMDSIYEHLKEDIGRYDPSVIIEKAERKRENIDQQDLPGDVQDALQIVEDFIAGLQGVGADNQRLSTPYRIQLAALQYFNDPFDVILDSRPGEGLLDDAWVLLTAAEELGDVPQDESDTDRAIPEEVDSRISKVLNEIDWEHLLQLARAEKLVNPYERRLLTEVRNRRNTGKVLSPSELSFVEGALENLVEGGLLESSCGADNCSSCQSIAEAARALMGIDNGQPSSDGAQSTSRTDLSDEPSSRAEKERVRKRNTSPQHDRIYPSLEGPAFPHFAGRAKKLGILTSYERKALFDIGSKYMRGYDLTAKQQSFLESLVRALLDEGMLEEPCDQSPCEYCDALRELAPAV